MSICGETVTNSCSIAADDKIILEHCIILHLNTNAFIHTTCIDIMVQTYAIGIATSWHGHLLAVVVRLYTKFTWMNTEYSVNQPL